MTPMPSIKEALHKRISEKYAVKASPKKEESHPGKMMLEAIKKNDHEGMLSAMKACSEPDADDKY